MSHVTHMNESWHTYEWVMSHIRMSHVTPWIIHAHNRVVNCVANLSNESRHTYKWVMAHTWMSHVTPTNESRQTANRVPYRITCMNASSHTWASHDTQKTESWHTRISHEWATTHMDELWMSHDQPTKKVTSHIWMHRACRTRHLFWVLCHFTDFARLI